MESIQDATIVFEMEKIFEEKLNEFYTQVNTFENMHPQASIG
jgi:hypothetical protein